MIDKEYKIFEAFNKQLKKANIHLTIICTGGFVLQHYGMRATVGIDAFYNETNEIRTIIRKTGDLLDINPADENWLKNSIQSMNEVPPKDICKVLYQFSNLQVLIPPLAYIAGMKLKSAREQDIRDVALILERLSIDSPEQFEKILNDYGFINIDESLILEAFGTAYGFEWLEKYYIENEEAIIQKIRNNIH